MSLPSMERIIASYVRQQSNWEESIAFGLHYLQVSFVNEKLYSSLDFTVERTMLEAQ